MNKREVKQGDVFMINLFDNVGSEQGSTRPCIILSTESLNKNRDNVIIAPITSSLKKSMINHYGLLKENYNWFTYKKNIVLLECLRDISKKRLERKLGEIDKNDLDQILDLVVYDFKEFNP